MKRAIIIVMAFCIIATQASYAQEKERRFGFELNGGVSFATSKPSGTDLNTGLGFEGIIHYRVLQNTGIYAGWGWNRFRADHSFAGNDMCFEETGYVFGLQYKRSIGSSPLSYYFRAGGLYNHIELENAAGDIIADSGHGLGYQLTAGLEYQLGKNWSILPGIKYNNLSTDMDLEGIFTHLDHQYLSVRVGFLKKF